MGAIGMPLDDGWVGKFGGRGMIGLGGCEMCLH